jgi:hypothetical protein
MTPITGSSIGTMVIVEEFRLAGVTLKPGMQYADVLRAATADPVSLRMFVSQFGVSDGNELVHQRLEGFGRDRSCDYRTFTGRIVRIDEHLTVAGAFAADPRCHRRASRLQGAAQGQSAAGRRGFG